MVNPFPYHERFEATQMVFRQQLALLEETIPAAPEAVRLMLVEIRHCAIELHNHLEAIDVTPPLPSKSYGSIVCFDCGKRNLEVFHTSNRGGYRLCSGCFDYRARAGRARSAH
jgi:formylmethanofuran dehydrogenase subunit E